MEVGSSNELSRIRSIPRRKTSNYDVPTLQRMLTERFRAPGGTQTLRPVQAIALAEAYQFRRLFGCIRVGEGKTLISFLLPMVFEAERPLLLLPAALIEKTERERREYARNWNIPRHIKMMSYTALGLEKNDGYLELWKPDLIIGDEAHKLRNLKTASRAKKFRRWRRANPHVPLCLMSGSFFSDSLADAAHILGWTHGGASPLPAAFECEAWDNAISAEVENPNSWQSSYSPGALNTLVGPDDVARQGSEDEMRLCRYAVGRRILETPGVVATTSPSLDVPLTIRNVGYPLNSDVQDAVHVARRDSTTPDGWMMWEAFEVSRLVRWLSLGMYYRWDPFPPEEWYLKRKAVSAELREVLSGSRIYDNPTAVIQAHEDGRIHLQSWDDWQDIKPTFEPTSRAVWLDDVALNFAAQWMQTERGMVWSMNKAFSLELSKRTGVPFYCEGGLDKKSGRVVSKHPANVPAICSINANRQGQNLQQVNRALMVDTPSSGEWQQQLLGRHHRAGQRHPVNIDVVQVSLEQVRALSMGRTRHGFAEDLLGDRLKLHEARLHVINIDDAEGFPGPMWGNGVA